MQQDQPINDNRDPRIKGQSPAQTCRPSIPVDEPGLLDGYKGPVGSTSLPAGKVVSLIIPDDVGTVIDSDGSLHNIEGMGLIKLQRINIIDDDAGVID